LPAICHEPHLDPRSLVDQSDELRQARADRATVEGPPAKVDVLLTGTELAFVDDVVDLDVEAQSGLEAMISSTVPVASAPSDSTPTISPASRPTLSTE
jgi:hypothetical protein